MISNLSEYFIPEQEIFLDTISYKRIEDSKNEEKQELSLLCKDDIDTLVTDDFVQIIITRELVFYPEAMFSLIVSFGACLKFNERKEEQNWADIDLAKEFSENGQFITSQLMSRISLLIGQITSSFGQQPLVLPVTIINSH